MSFISHSHAETLFGINKQQQHFAKSLSVVTEQAKTYSVCAVKGEQLCIMNYTKRLFKMTDDNLFKEH